MSFKSRAKINFRNIVWVIAIIVVPFGLVLIEYKLGEHWLIVALLFVIVSVLTAFSVEHHFVPAAYRRLRKEHAEAASLAKKHPMLEAYYNDGVNRTASELNEIIKGRFSFPVSEVPEMSLIAMRTVNKECILTFPLEHSEALLTPKSGNANKYYVEMVTASKRMQSTGNNRVTRIFILKKSEEISGRILEFIKNNISDGIDVKLILEDDVPIMPNIMESLDFGYYATQLGSKWVMILKQNEGNVENKLVNYTVDTDPRRVCIYRQYADDLLNKARGFDEIMRLVMRPVNGDLWPTFFAERRYEMQPPHGLSEEDADYVVSSALRRVEDPTQSSILILGFTPKIIRNLIARRVRDIVSIDQCESKPTEFANMVKFETGNWLNISREKKFDAIVFDESINNLSKIQLGLFFQQMSTLLKNRGILVGRVMGRFETEQVGKYANLSPGQSIDMLRHIKGNNHDDYAPLIICLLHSKNTAFLTEAATVDCEKWNRTLITLRNDGYITEQEYRIWRLQFNFKLLSPDQDTLFKEARKTNFSLSEARPVQGAYIDKCEDTVGFYRLFNFEHILE